MKTFGQVLLCFVLACIMTYYVALMHILKANDENHRIDLELFTYILPFVSFVIDHVSKRAYNINVKTVFLACKTAFIFIYLATYVMSL